MINNTSSAFAILAVPALVGMLLFPLSAQASEGADQPIMAPQAARPATPPAPAATPGPVVAVQVPTPATTRPITPAPRPIAAGPVWTDATGVWRQVGVASWYGGRRWQGRPTASGVRYDERQLTAAHASLPIGSQVRVTVAETGRTVVVTINDRPGTRKRIIDLSRAAAAELGILGRGVARVTITPG
jgi:rare lipoprotein A (peptidoglycan hydrolase)